MDRRLAEKNLRSGLGAASLAIGIFALAFIVAIFYIG
jgi:hypothetical protein